VAEPARGYVPVVKTARARPATTKPRTKANPAAKTTARGAVKPATKRAAVKKKK
jgi:hypothetical protein